MISPKITQLAYQKVAKPILFQINPEKVHNAHVYFADLAGRVPPAGWLTKKIWSYQNQTLEQTIDGILYKNPIGLAAGWDKDAHTMNFMESIGFGAAEMGSITQFAYGGNKGTRLWRLKKSKSILVYYGLKNEGVDIIAPRIAKAKSNIPIGTNIARTNSPACDDESGIKDYAYSFKVLADIGDYFTVNISCPNTHGGQPFHDKRRLNNLLTELDKIKTKKPVYVKISPDISIKERKGIAELSFNHNVAGFICGNVTKNRNNKNIKDENIADVGGMSGLVVQRLGDELVADMYRLTKGKKTIIGLGGVFNATDAYRKIRLGASLVQMITGLIYEGPQVVGQINRDLVAMLAKDGYKNINQAVGISN